MKILIDVPKKIHDRIRSVLIRGEYGDINEMIVVALENQIRAELGEGDVWGISSSESLVEDYTTASISTVDIKSPRLLPRPLESPIFFEPPNDRILFGGPLWGQFYRFLPSKVGLRVLANMSRATSPNLEEFRSGAATIAVTFGRMLSKKDAKLGRKFGEELSASFPSNTDKSRKRFMDQYLVHFRPGDSKIDSLPARLKWLNVIREGKLVKVGITRSGYELAKLENPILDGDGTEPLSQMERELILSFIAENHRAEAQHIALVLQAISSGVSSREQLNQKMGGEYRGRWTEAQSWSAAVISTMRAGVVGRLFELGLVEKRKIGLNVSYSVTPEGSRWMERMERTLRPLEAKTND